MFRSRFTKTALSMLTVTLCSALLVVGCSDDDDNDGGGGPFTNGVNDMWLNCSFIEERNEEVCAGTAFRNGIAFNSWQELGMGNTWYEDDGFATYTTSGNRITLVGIDSDQIIIYTYSVSGNTLHLTWIVNGVTRTATATRKTGLTFIRESLHRSHLHRALSKH